jgi:hypothetical protein
VERHGDERNAGPLRPLIIRAVSNGQSFTSYLGVPPGQVR